MKCNGALSPLSARGLAVAVAAAALLSAAALRAAPIAPGDLGSKENPVRCDRKAGARAYVERLRGAGDDPVKFRRIGIGGSRGSHTLELYEIAWGDETAKLYLDIDCPGHVESEPVAGLKILAPDSLGLDSKPGKFERPATRGAEVGVWTYDYDAAKALAEEKQLPMLVFYSADYCKRCRTYERNILSTGDWKNWASTRLVLLNIDGSDNPAAPGRLGKQHKELIRIREIRYFPSFDVYSPGGVKIGWVRLDREKEAELTPAEFVKAVEEVLDRKRRKPAQQQNGGAAAGDGEKDKSKGGKQPKKDESKQ